MDIKSWIKAARSHAGLTQTQLGEPLGVGKGNVSAWEKGRHEPSFEQLVRISDITGYKEPLPGLAAAPAKSCADVRPWPFPAVSESVIRSLPQGSLKQLEGALLLALGQMGVNANATPPGQKSPLRQDS